MRIDHHAKQELKAIDFFKELVELKTAILNEKKEKSNLKRKITLLENQLEELKDVNSSKCLELLKNPAFSHYEISKDTSVRYIANFELFGKKYECIDITTFKDLVPFKTFLKEHFTDFDSMRVFFSDKDINRLVNLGLTANNSSKDLLFVKKNFEQKINEQNQDLLSRADRVLDEKSKLEIEKNNKLIEIKNIENSFIKKLTNSKTLKVLKQEVRELNSKIKTKQSTYESYMVQIIPNVKTYVETNLNNLIAFSTVYNELNETYSKMLTVSIEAKLLKEKLAKITNKKLNEYNEKIEKSFNDNYLKNYLLNLNKEYYNEKTQLSVIADIESIYKELVKEDKKLKEAEILSLIDKVL